MCAWRQQAGRTGRGDPAPGGRCGSALTSRGVPSAPAPHPAFPPTLTPSTASPLSVHSLASPLPPASLLRCSITSDFLAQFNKEKSAIEGTIDAVM